MVGEVIATADEARAFCGDAGDGLHLIFLFESLGVPLTAPAVRALIERYETLFAAPLLPTWVFGNHDRRRRIARLDGSLEKAKLNAAWQLTARGVPFLYNGEEIGIEQHHLPVRTSLDAVVDRFRSWPQPLFDLVCRLAGESLNRDECRTPMQWSDEPNAGFCPRGVAPWLPVTPSYRERNVATQQLDPDSLWHCYRRFLAARRQCAALNAGALELLPASDLPATVVGYVRRAAPGAEPRAVIVLLNCGDAATDVNLPARATPWVSTRARLPEVGADRVRLRPWEGLVLTLGETGVPDLR